MDSEPGGSPNRWPRNEWFESQVQDRSPVTVYRGIGGPGRSYNPEHYWGGPFQPEWAHLRDDTRIFTTENLIKASRHPKTDTVILKMQIPRFLLYTRDGGPWGSVFFRDMVPNDLVFVSDIAFLPPGTAVRTVPNFIPLEEAIPHLSPDLALPKVSE